MKGLVLTGGSGTRMRPITYSRTKQLIPVANQPVLFYAVHSLVNSGITELAFVCGQTMSEVQHALAAGRARFPSWRQTEFSFIYQPEAKGLAHAVLLAEPFVGRAQFCMQLGDNLLQNGLKWPDYPLQGESAHVFLTRVQNPEQFGVVLLDESGKVNKLVEKPRKPVSDLTLTGIYVFEPEIFEACRLIRPSARGELEITDAIQQLVDSGFLVGHTLVEGWWKDTGRPEDLIIANRLILTAKTPDLTLQPCSSDDGSTIRGPVSIGENCKIVKSYIGPYTSIGDNCEIVNSEIENSIIMDGATIQNVLGRIDGSIIGAGAVVSGGDGVPTAHRLVLGDKSLVTLSR